MTDRWTDEPCASETGCTARRLRYSAYCAKHAGVRPVEERAPRCVAPLRCYCPVHAPLLPRVLTTPMSGTDLKNSRRLAGNHETGRHLHAVSPAEPPNGRPGMPGPADLATSMSGPVRARLGAPGPTAAAAAELSGLPVGLLRRSVFLAIASAGATGATDDDLERHLGKPHQTVSSARNWLVSEGWVADTGRQRMTRSHRAATVWAVAAAAQEAARIALAERLP